MMRMDNEIHHGMMRMDDEIHFRTRVSTVLFIYEILTCRLHGNVGARQTLYFDSSQRSHNLVYFHPNFLRNCTWIPEIYLNLTFVCKLLFLLLLDGKSLIELPFTVLCFRSCSIQSFICVFNGALDISFWKCIPRRWAWIGLSSCFFMGIFAWQSMTSFSCGRSDHLCWRNIVSLVSYSNKSSRAKWSTRP